MAPSRSARLATGQVDQLQADRVHLEMTRDADRSGQLASREPLAERRVQPVTGVRQHTAADLSPENSSRNGVESITLQGAEPSGSNRNRRQLSGISEIDFATTGAW
jgi:hypothetical protein